MLREYLKIASEDTKLQEYKYVERAGQDGMEKVLGMGAEVFELLLYEDCDENRQKIKEKRRKTVRIQRKMLQRKTVGKSI